MDSAQNGNIHLIERCLSVAGQRGRQPGGWSENRL